MDSCAKLLFQQKNIINSPIEEARLEKLVQQSVKSFEDGSILMTLELINSILEKLQASSSLHKFLVNVNTVAKNEETRDKAREGVKIDKGKQEAAKPEEPESDQSLLLEKMTNDQADTEKIEVLDKTNRKDEFLENKGVENELCLAEGLEKDQKESIENLQEFSEKSKSKSDIEENNRPEHQQQTSDKLDSETDTILIEPEGLVKGQVQEEKEEVKKEEQEEESKGGQLLNNTPEPQNNNGDRMKDRITLKSSFGSVWNEEKDGLANYKITSQNTIYLITVIWISMR